jgi:hypothetical protein
MTPAEATHFELTKVRAAAYEELFGGKPTATHSARALGSGPTDAILIDVFVYELAFDDDVTVDVAVTNGLSDVRMADADDPGTFVRRELIQYFPTCMPEHAKRLRDMAWLPLFDKFLLDAHHVIEWPHAAIEGTPWKNALFLVAYLEEHREFTFEVDGDPVSFLWHVPLTDAELAYARAEGINELLDRMSEARVHWQFDEDDRPQLE